MINVIRVSLLLCTLYLGVAEASSSDQANVTISLDNKRYSFNSGVRLANVLQSVKGNKVFFPLTSQLYKLSNAKNDKRQQFYDLMRSSEFSNQNFEFLLKQIYGWELGQRQRVVLDLDLARLREESNPVVDNGNYLLQLNKRPDSVYLFGAVNRDLTLPHLSMAPVNDYLDNESISKTDLTASDHVFIVQPNGVVAKVGVSYWNQSTKDNDTQVMPGSAIFVPFKSSSFSSKYDQINHMLIELVQDRISL